MQQEQRVKQRALELGISETQKEYFWIAEQSLSAPVPEGWIERDDGYFNLLTEQSQMTHPSLDYYRQLYQIMNTDKLSMDSPNTIQTLPPQPINEPSFPSPSLGHNEKIPVLHSVLEKIESFFNLKGIGSSNAKPRQNNVSSIVDDVHSSVDTLLTHLHNATVSKDNVTWTQTLQLLVHHLEADLSSSAIENKLLALGEAMVPFGEMVNFTTWQTIIVDIFGPNIDSLSALGHKIVPIMAEKYFPSQHEDDSVSMKSQLEALVSKLEKKLANAQAELVKSKQLAERLKKTELELTKEIDAYQQKHRVREVAFDSIMATNSELRSQIEELSQRCTELMAQTPETDGGSAAPSQKELLLQAERDEAKRRVRELEDKLNNLESLSGAGIQLELVQSLECASKKINRKKELILGLRERNNDLKKANALLAQELQHAVAMSQGLNNECESLRLQKQPPPYRVIEKTITSITSSLEAKTGQVEDLEITLAMITADRDDLAKVNKDSQSYISLLESQLQEIKSDNQTKSDTILTLTEKIRNYERVQEQFVQKILSIRSDCDRLCLKLSEYEGNRRVICKFRHSAGTPHPLIPLSRDAATSGDRGSRDARFQFNGLEFSYHNVFLPSTTQEAFFEEVEPSIRKVMRGGRLSVLSYGSAASGKTFTMAGSPANAGVIGRAFQLIFSIADCEVSRWDTSVSMSVVEIHNERIEDALAYGHGSRLPSDQPEPELIVRSVGRDHVFVEGLSGWPVKNAQDVQFLLAKLEKQAISYESTEHKSFRSHIVYSVEITRTSLSSQEVTRGYLQLVDLAASNHHRVSAYDAQSQWRFKEGQYINRSLGALADVLASIGSQTGPSAVPPRYRSSKLTHMLQEFLQPNAKIIIIVNADISSENIEETVESLKFGTNCKL